MIVLDDLNLLKVERLVTIAVLTINLSGLECQLLRLRLAAQDLLLRVGDGFGCLRVLD